MKTEWDYTKLANSYLKRPSYSEEAIKKVIKIANIVSGDSVCDIGAGTAHLTLLLLKHDLNVIAIEPNDEMRKNGINRTLDYMQVSWIDATAEDTKQADSMFSLVTFGSSFNVTKRDLALKEAYRILKPKGYFACMWNHRDLNDPIQSEIEQIIKTYVKDYDYGTRREDQTQIIKDSNLFGEVTQIESLVSHEQSVEDCIEAWRSHNTLCRQAKDKFNQIISDIESMFKKSNKENIIVPYTTRVWVAQVKK